MKNIPDSKFQIPNSQSGVTLLMSVLIMSALVLISTTVAFLAVQEIRAARAQQVSESAVNAAKIGAEEGLWLVKRDGVSSLPDCSASSISVPVPSSKSYLNYCKSFGSGTFDITSSAPVQILLYNPNDPDNDVDLSEFVYQNLTVTRTGPFAINVDVTRIDGTAVANFQASQSNLPTTVNIPGVPANQEGRMLVTLTSLGDTSAVVTTNKGLPSKVNIASTACSTKVLNLSSCAGGSDELFTRKIEVKVSN